MIDLMGLRGTYPKPDWLRVIEGNPGKRPPRGNDSSKLVESLAAPEFFNTEQTAIWNDVVHVLVRVRALTEGDKFQLERYVDFLYQYRLAADFMRQNSKGQIVYTVKGPVIKDESGNSKRETKQIKLLPHINAMLILSNHLCKIENYFGLNPSARANFGKPSSGEGQHDPFDYPD